MASSILCAVISCLGPNSESPRGLLLIAPKDGVDSRVASAEWKSYTPGALTALSATLLPFLLQMAMVYMGNPANRTVETLKAFTIRIPGALINSDKASTMDY